MYTNGNFECDRCGKHIGYGERLCKECNEWLEKYCKEHSDDNEESDS